MSDPNRRGIVVEEEEETGRTLIVSLPITVVK